MRRARHRRPRTRGYASTTPGPDAVLPMLVVLALYPAGGVTRAAPALLVPVLAVSAALSLPAVQRWMAGGDLARRVGLRAAVHLGVVTTLAVYLLDWGPVLTVAYAVVALEHVNLSGSRAWRPALAWSLAGVAAGQVGIATGVLRTALDPVPAQLCAVGGAALVALLVRRYGLLAADRERDREALLGSEQRFRAMVQYSSDLILSTDAEGTIRYASPAAEDLLGRTPAELLGRPMVSLVHEDDLHRAELIGSELRLRENGAVVFTELRFRRQDGTVRWHHVTMRNLLGTPGVEAVVVNHRDVTDERLAQEKLDYDASHDVLTGLDNRAAFVTDLAEALARAQFSGEPVAVLLIDLDGFKQVNDTLGHEAGDVVLMSVAGLLRRQVQGADVIGRIGGDEFAVALPGIGSRENAEAAVQRLLHGLDEPVPVHGHNLVVTASIGLAVTEHGGDPVDAQEMVRRADLAMYDAKRSRTRHWAPYHPGLEPAARITAEEIRGAVEREELFLLYQPIVSLEIGQVVAVEALVRWNHPQRGLVPPTDFIPIAEETGLIGLVGEWVMRTACVQLAAWRAHVPAAGGLSMSVNVAADQLEDAATAGLVHDTLLLLDLPAASLLVEVTESALADSAAARATLEALHLAGVRIAIDDFGTGYSSLQYLTRLPCDVLKLDRGFVAELDGTPEGSAIAEAVVRLAQTLHLATTAEGAETEEQVAELAALGYTNAQGYLFAKPLPPDEVVGLLGRRLFTRPERDVPAQGA